MISQESEQESSKFFCALSADFRAISRIASTSSTFFDEAHVGAMFDASKVFSFPKSLVLLWVFSGANLIDIFFI